MSKTEPKGFEDFAPSEDPTPDGPKELKLETGEWVTGIVQNVDDAAGQYESLAVDIEVLKEDCESVDADDLVRKWETWDFKRQVNNLRLRAGDEIALMRTEDRDISDDGEEPQFIHQYDLRVD